MCKTYKSIRLLRLVLANHPSTQDVEVPEWLYKGEITTY